MTSIFTKIINREVPAHIIYEDDRTLAFLDINPIQPGHTVVVTKTEVDRLNDLANEDYQAVMATAKLLMSRLKTRMDTERVCLIVEGFEVAHAHVKLIPCNTAEDLHATPAAVDDDALKRLAEQLQA